MRGSKEAFFDRNDVFEKQVQPLIKQLFDLCRENELPMLVATVYKHTDHGDGESFDIAGGVSGPLNHMPVPMMIAGGLLEEGMTEHLHDARRAYVGMQVSGAAAGAKNHEMAALWRQAVAMSAIEAASIEEADKMLDEAIQTTLNTMSDVAEDLRMSPDMQQRIAQAMRSLADKLEAVASEGENIVMSDELRSQLEGLLGKDATEEDNGE